jgi:hypothetical protein
LKKKYSNFEFFELNIKNSSFLCLKKEIFKILLSFFHHKKKVINLKGGRGEDKEEKQNMDLIRGDSS